MEASSNQKTYALFSNPANRKLVAQIEQTGAKVFQFERIQPEKLNVDAGLELIKSGLNTFDWIIFPDIYAVEYFLEMMEENEIDLFELDEIRVLAAGEAVADRLRFVQLHADIIPQTIEPETIFSSLLSYTGTANLANLKCLIPKESAFDGTLKKILIDAGAYITELAVYQAHIEDKNKTANLKALLKGGAIDEFIFTSAEDIMSIKFYVFPEKLTGLFPETIASGIDEITMQTLRENDLHSKFFQIKRG